MDVKPTTEPDTMILDHDAILRSVDARNLIADLAEVLGNLRVELDQLGAKSIIADVTTGCTVEDNGDVTFKCSVSLRYSDTSVFRSACPILLLTFPKFTGAYPSEAIVNAATRVTQMQVHGAKDPVVLLAASMSRAEVTAYIADAIATHPRSQEQK